MPKRRKEGNKFTTISISWDDKTRMRGLAKFKKETRNGRLYESDAEVFMRIIAAYINSHPQTLQKAHSTYPTALQGLSQRG